MLKPLISTFSHFTFWTWALHKAFIERLNKLYSYSNGSNDAQPNQWRAKCSAASPPFHVLYAPPPPLTHTHTFVIAVRHTHTHTHTHIHIQTHTHTHTHTHTPTHTHTHIVHIYILCCAHIHPQMSSVSRIRILFIIELKVNGQAFWHCTLCKFVSRTSWNRGLS